MKLDDGYLVWKAMIEDAVDRGEVHYLPEERISGHLYDAAATLASACACRGRLHAACVWPTIQRGEPLDMPEDWRDWVQPVMPAKNEATR